MESSSALIRYKAILKFQNLWRFRHQFWIRLEANARSMMKVSTKKEIHKNNIEVLLFDYL